MKHYLKLFIAIELILFSYIFTSSIFQIYEKNHVTSDSMKCYALTNTDSNKLASFYDEIVRKIEHYSFEQTINTVSETNNTEYILYCYPFEKFTQKQPITSSIHFKYDVLGKDDFVDSTGLFYSDMPFETLDLIAKNNGLILKSVIKDRISYSTFLNYYMVDFVILFIVIQIVYGIYTSYNMKKIGIKKSMGFPEGKVIKEQIGIAICYLAIAELCFILVMSIYYIYNKSLSIAFLRYLILYYIGVNIINVICILNTMVVTKFVTMESMVKKHSLNKAMSVAAQTIKILFVLLISISVSRVLIQAEIYKKQQVNIINYKMLNDYYTANGFFSDKYDEVYSNESAMNLYSSNMKSMYNDNQALLCDCSSFDLSKIEGIGDKIPEYELNSIYSNKNYIDQFGTIKINGEEVTVENDVYTVFVAEKYKNHQGEINEYIYNELYNMVNYNRNYGLSKHSNHEVHYDLIYIDDDSTITCNTSNGFEEKNIGVLFVDNGESGGMLYLDWLNGGFIFYKLNSREEFKSLLVKYNLDDLVSPGTLLTPYYNKLENVEFTLKTLSIFAIVFTASLLFIIYIAGYVDIIANKTIYSSKEIHGHNHSRILKKRYLVLFSESLIIILLAFCNFISLWTLVIVPLDFILYEILYIMFVKNKIYKNIKGA